MLSYMISANGNISFITQTGHSKYVERSHKNYAKILDAIRDGNEDLVLDLIDKTKALTKYFTNSTLSIKDGVMYCGNEEIHNSLTKRIIDFCENNLPYEPLVRFLDKLLQNPSSSSVNELYDFLANEKLPITEDGDFLAYKSVRKDGKDWHSNKILYAIGTYVEMPRRNVDDNRSNGCSYGLHAGSIDYVQGFHWNDGQKLIVKINPADVVSVPNHDCRKLRTCKLFVLCKYNGDLEHPLYQNDGTDFVDNRYDYSSSCDGCQCDDCYDEDDYYDDEADF